jgi:hypothetical protein
MRVSRVGSIRLALAVGVATALGAVAADAAPATTPAAAPPTTVIKPSFKVAITPEYTTAGRPTTFQITIVNTSPRGTTLGSVKISAPSGFTSPRPTPGSPFRRKTKVRNRTLMLHEISLTTGKRAQLSITANAPAKCGSGTILHWSSQAFEGQSGSGTQLPLDPAISSLGVKVLCPAAVACGDGGPPCSTSLVTSDSTYAVISDAASGTLNQTVNVGNKLRCGNYRFRDPNWYDSVVTNATTSPPTAVPTPIVDNVTYTIRNATMKGIGFCLGAAYDFATASRSQARPRALPNGNPGFMGLLPMCTNAKPPCITSITQQPDANARTGYDATMDIQIPEAGDPWGGG